MEALIVFVVLGIAFLVQQRRIGRLQRTLDEVIAEVQRQRDVLANTSAARDEPQTPLSQPASVGFTTQDQRFSASPPLAAAPASRVETPAALSDPLRPFPPPAIVIEAGRSAVPSRTAFEDLFGSKLPIWAGGVTLAVAGVLIVKLAIDTGLITPVIRVVLAYAFSALLIAAGELARRWSATAIDPRVSQALAGAGVASAYGATLIAENLYHLIDPATAFVLLALITAGALGLALRFGAPSAVLGLVGGLAAPALVGGKGDVATLAAYLSLTILGLAAVARHRRWRWLAALALVGGFGWGATMLVMQAVQSAAVLPIGAYLLMLAFAVPFVAGRDVRGLIRLLPPGVAAVQIAVLVVQGGFAPLVWAFYGLLAVAVIVLARIDAAQRPLPPMALAVGLVTVALWPHPSFAMLTAILLIGGALFAGDAAQRVRTGDARDSGQFAGALLAGFALGYIKLTGMTTHGWAAIALGLALIALALAATLWRTPRREDGRFAVLVTTALVLVDAALILAVQHHWLPVAMVWAAVGTIALAWRARDPILAVAARVALGIGVFALAATWSILDEGARLFDIPIRSGAAVSFARWMLVAAGTGGFAWREVDRRSARLVCVAAALLAFVGLAQIGGGMGQRLIVTTLVFALGALAWRFIGVRSNPASTGVVTDASQKHDPSLESPLLTFDRTGARWVAIGATVLAIARTMWFDLAIGDPLLTAQRVGALPLLNLLAPAYLLPLVWLGVAARHAPALARRFTAPWTALQIALILAFAPTSVRQLFHGTVLTGGHTGQAEDIARSLTAIVLAVGFLLWGIRVKSRAWRITSLVLMLGAVGKVFLFDAAGLDGLLRIGSFVALGFSLIGIGWLYSRYLARDDLPQAEGIGIGAA